MRSRICALLVLSAAILASTCQAQTVQEARVLVSGTGTEPHINTVIDGIIDYLKTNNVSVSLLGGDIKTRTSALEKLSSSASESLLYITLDIAAGQRDKLSVQCFDKQGKQLWAEETGSGMAASFSGAVKNMLKSIKPKLARHLGQPGLSKA